LIDATEINELWDNLDIKILPMYRVAFARFGYSAVRIGRCEGADRTLPFEDHVAFLQDF